MAKGATVRPSLHVYTRSRFFVQTLSGPQRFSKILKPTTTHNPFRWPPICDSIPRQRPHNSRNKAACYKTGTSLLVSIRRGLPSLFVGEVDGPSCLLRCTLAGVVDSLYLKEHPDRRCLWETTDDSDVITPCCICGVLCTRNVEGAKRTENTALELYILYLL